MHNKKILIILVSILTIIGIALSTYFIVANIPTNRAKANQQQASKFIDQANKYIEQKRLNLAKEAATKALNIYKKLEDTKQITNTQSILKIITLANNSAVKHFTNPTNSASTSNNNPTQLKPVK